MVKIPETKVYNKTIHSPQSDVIQSRASYACSTDDPIVIWKNVDKKWKVQVNTFALLTSNRQVIARETLTTDCRFEKDSLDRRSVHIYDTNHNEEFCNPNVGVNRLKKAEEICGSSNINTFP